MDTRGGARSAWVLIQHPYDGAHEAKVYYDIPKKEAHAIAENIKKSGGYAVVIQAIKFQEFMPTFEEIQNGFERPMIQSTIALNEINKLEQWWKGASNEK